MTSAQDQFSCLQIPCCKTMMLKHSNLSTSSTADTRLTLSSLVRGGRGVWQTKQGTVLHFNMKRKQWQVSIHFYSQIYLNIFVEVSSSLETEGSDWAASSSTALCPGEAARVSSFTWRQERLEIVCT